MIVKPSGTGRPIRVISARLAPLPPSRNRWSAVPSRNRRIQRSGWAGADAADPGGRGVVIALMLGASCGGGDRCRDAAPVTGRNVRMSTARSRHGAVRRAPVRRTCSRRRRRADRAAGAGPARWRASMTLSAVSAVTRVTTETVEGRPRGTRRTWSEHGSDSSRRGPATAWPAVSDAVRVSRPAAGGHRVRRPAGRRRPSHCRTPRTVRIAV